MVKTIALAAGISLISLSANAQLLNFEDVSFKPNAYYDLTSYNGYNFTNGALINQDYYTKSGYKNGTISGTNTLFNYYNKELSITKTGGGLFDLTSAFMTAAWEDGIVVNVTGWLNGQKVNSVNISLNTTTPGSATQFNFAGIDKVTFNTIQRGTYAGYLNTGGQFAIDNLVLNPIAPVPEPSTYAMMFAGLGAIGLMVRRRKAVN